MPTKPTPATTRALVEPFEQRGALFRAQQSPNAKHGLQLLFTEFRSQAANAVGLFQQFGFLGFLCFQQATHVLARFAQLTPQGPFLITGSINEGVYLRQGLRIKPQLFDKTLKP